MAKVNQLVADLVSYIENTHQAENALKSDTHKDADLRNFCLAQLLFVVSNSSYLSALNSHRQL